MVVFDASETKGRRSLDAAMPDLLAPYVRRYLDHYRPILLTLRLGSERHATDALWVSLWGRPLSPRSLANPVNKRTRAAFGTSIPPHWFRHAAGTTVAIEDSRHVTDTCVSAWKKGSDSLSVQLETGP